MGKLRWVYLFLASMFVYSAYEVGVLKGRSSKDHTNEDERIMMLVNKVVRQQEEISRLSEKVLTLIEKEGH